MNLETFTEMMQHFSTKDVFFGVMVVIVIGIALVYVELMRPVFRSWWKCIILVLVSLLIGSIYSPVFLSEFVYQDDYYLWLWDKERFHTHPEYLFIFSIGRPIANFFLFPVFSLVDTLGDANAVRLIGVFLIILVFHLLCQVLVETGFSLFSSLCINFLLVTSLSFQVYSVWLMAVYIPLAIIFSILSAFLAIRVVDLLLDESRDLPRLRVVIYCLLSVLLCLLCLAAYQPSAGFFACLAAISIIKDRGGRGAKLVAKIKVFGGIYILSNVLYFFAYRIAIAKFSSNDFVQGYDPNAVGNLLDISVLFARFIWFLKVPFFNSMNPLNYESVFLSVGLLLVFVASIYYLISNDLKCANGVKPQVVRSVALKYVSIFGFVVASFGAILISDNSDENYRTIASLILFCLVAVFLAGKLIMISSVFVKRLLVMLLVSACLFNAIHGYRYIGKLTSFHTAEISFLREKIESVSPDAIRKVTFVPPRERPIITNVKHEINQFTAAFYKPDYLLPMLSNVYSEHFSPEQLKRLRIVAFYEGEEIVANEGYADPFGRIRLKVEGYHGFNVIQGGDYFFAILQGEGAFSIERIANRSYSSFLFSDDEADLLELLDQFESFSEQGRVVLIDEHYNLFRPILNKETLASKARTVDLTIDMNELLDSEKYRR